MIRRPHHAFLLSWSQFQNLSCRLIGYQLRSNIRDCYSILNVTDDSSDDEVKEAYLKLAKVYHPDSGTSSADPRKFNQIKEAYVAIKSHRRERNTTADTDPQIDEDLDFDIKHTVPQHRQYLSYDGVGFGTPLQRQKQYAQHRVRKVSEDLFEHKKAKWMKPSETALVNKTKSIARRNKMSKTIDRVVEDLIQESMQRGDFDNLAGYGKPIQYKDRNPLVDATTYKINQMLKDEGFAPDWIMLEKDIRDGISESRGNLAKVIERIGTPPFSSSHLDKVWKYECEKFKSSISLVNDIVKKFNLIVPVMKKQLIPYSWDRELDRVIENHREYLAGSPSKSAVPDSVSNSILGEKTKIYSYDDSFRSQDSTSNSYDNVILWGEVWKQIKLVFTWKKSKTS